MIMFWIFRMLKTIEEILLACKTAILSTNPTSVLNGNLYRWKGCVTNILTGTLKLKSWPYFGFVIVDDSGYIPCLIGDAARYLATILKLCDQEIILREPLCISEMYILNNKGHESTFVFVKGCDIHVVNHKPSVWPLPNMTMEESNSEDVPIIHIAKFLVKVLLVSSAILSYEPNVYCFVLVEVLESDLQELDKNVWIILKNSQVTWKDLLLPNRKYKIMLPRASAANFINQLPMSIIIQNHFCSTFKDMYHHKELIVSKNAIYLPTNTEISLIPSEPFHCNNDKWVLITPSRKVKFVSVVGTVREINYSNAWKSSSCSMCNNSLLASINYADDKQINTDQHTWINPWITDTADIPSDGIDIKNIEFSRNPDDAIIGFGIRSGKVSVQVSIFDENTGACCYVFLKDWKQQQYPSGLTIGATICFTNVCVKQSKRDNVYYTSTPLTRLLYLDLKADNPVPRMIMGTRVKFGFPFWDTNEKVWGVLDIDTLVKVSIMARCSYCNGQVLQRTCVNTDCKPPVIDSTNDKSGVAVTPSAHVKVKNIFGKEETSLYIKNDNVKIYLGIPDHIWRNLLSIAEKSELLYLIQDDKNVLDNVEEDPMELFFYLYCKYFRPKKRFHVFCRKIKGSENRYFCLDVEEINNQRLSTMYSMNDVKV